MTTREQLTHERLESLIDTLEALGYLSPDWSESLKQTKDLGDGRKVAKNAREGNGPPNFAND